MTRRNAFLLALALIGGLIVPIAGAHDALTVTMSRTDCARLAEHLPAPDVAFQSGVDVRGRQVVPADLDGSTRIAAPETVLIDIEIDLLERFGIPANPALFDADAEVGEVTYRDGRLTFNGQPLQSEAEAELAKRCQRVIRDREKASTR